MDGAGSSAVNSCCDQDDIMSPYSKPFKARFLLISNSAYFGANEDPQCRLLRGSSISSFDFTEVFAWGEASIQD